MLEAFVELTRNDPVVDVSISYSSTSLLQSSSRFLKELTEEASTTLAGNLFHVPIISD